MNVRLSKKGASFMRLHEGFVAKWYLDPVGIPTIGIGFTWRSTAFRKWWSANKPGVKFARGASMTRAEAEACLQFLVREEYGLSVNHFFKGKKIEQHLFDGCTSVVYNVGARSLEWKWAQAIRRGDIAEGAKRLETTATTAQGVKLRGLVRRRKEEAELVRSGVYHGVDRVRTPYLKVPAMADGMLERGERGPDVAQLIVDLKMLGFYDGVMDDVFGYGTESAVLEFQRQHSIEADGKAGPETLGTLKQALKKKPDGSGGGILAWLSSLLKG